MHVKRVKVYVKTQRNRVEDSLLKIEIVFYLFTVSSKPLQAQWRKW